MSCPPAGVATDGVIPEPRGPRPRQGNLPRQMVGGHPSRTCPGKPGAALARAGQVGGTLRWLAGSVP